MSNQSKKILIAEDDGFISEVYSTKLASIGYNVRVANDGEEALKKVQEEIPDLLMLDILMPKLNGFEVMEKLRADKKYLELPILVLTNAGEKDSVDKALELGAKDYLIKSSFTPEEVVAKVKEVLGEK